jgi:hypothetical protein
LEKLEQFFSAEKLLPALTMFFGIILIESGILNATSTNTIHTLSNTVIVTYPKLFVGLLMTIIGVATAVGGYLIFHGKLRLK